MGQIFNFLTNFVSITGNFWIDAVWVGIIGTISFGVGWDVTRSIAEDLGYNRVLMSIVHWFIRISAFVLLVEVNRCIYYVTQL